MAFKQRMMLKVKEYLDEHFSRVGKCTVEGNGVYGSWIYPKGCEPDVDHISLHINNETITNRIYIDGKYVSKYSYLQTYQHIPRGKPDINGYYRRSTDDEVIRYIDSYLQQIKEREKCKTQV